MHKTKYRFQGILIGTIITSMLLTTMPALAVTINDSLYAVLSKIVVKIDGKPIAGDTIKLGNSLYVRADKVAEVLQKSFKLDNKASIASIGEEVVAPKPTPKPTNKYLTLSNEDIEQAIKEGKKGMTHVFTTFEDKYRLPYIGKSENKKYATACFYSPYYYIAAQCAVETNEFAKYTIEDGKKFLKEMIADNEMIFFINARGSSLKFHEPMTAALKIGEEYIKPSKTDGTDDMAEYISSKTYSAHVYFHFPFDKIDTTQKCQFIVNYPYDKQLVFDVDFSQYK